MLFQGSNPDPILLQLLGTEIQICQCVGSTVMLVFVCDWTQSCLECTVQQQIPKPRFLVLNLFIIMLTMFPQKNNILVNLNLIGSN